MRENVTRMLKEGKSSGNHLRTPLGRAAFAFFAAISQRASSGTMFHWIDSLFRLRVDKNGGAWCPKNMIEKETKEWLEIDLGSVHSLTAVESQGRFGNGQGVEFTEAYVLEYYRPRLRKWVRYRTKDEKEVLNANTNTYSAVKNELNPVILAQKIRFHPFCQFKRTICMRVEVYGCNYHGGYRVQAKIPPGTGPG